MKKQEHEEVSLPMVMSWATESSLRSWLLLPAGRARSGVHLLPAHQRPDPSAHPAGRPLEPHRLAPRDPPRQKKARLLPRLRLDQGRRLPADGATCPRACALQACSSPPAAASLLPLSPSPLLVVFV